MRIRLVRFLVMQSLTGRGNGYIAVCQLYPLGEKKSINGFNFYRTDLEGMDGGGVGV